MPTNKLTYYIELFIIVLKCAIKNGYVLNEKYTEDRMSNWLKAKYKSYLSVSENNQYFKSNGFYSFIYNRDFLYSLCRPITLNYLSKQKGEEYKTISFGTLFTFEIALRVTIMLFEIEGVEKIEFVYFLKDNIDETILKEVFEKSKELYNARKQYNII